LNAVPLCCQPHAQLLLLLLSVLLQHSVPLLFGQHLSHAAANSMDALQQHHMLK
jgi:hypothetical protein